MTPGSPGACSPNLLISTGVDECGGDGIGWICPARAFGMSVGSLAVPSGSETALVVGEPILSKGRVFSKLVELVDYIR